MSDRGRQLFQGTIPVLKCIVQAHRARFVLRRHPLKTGEEGLQRHQPGAKILLALFRLAHHEPLLGELEDWKKAA
jgi:hypothetical protein